MKQWYTFASLSILLFSCNTHKETIDSHFEAKYASGHTISVRRRDNLTEYVGKISRLHYGRTHSFSYDFVLEPGTIVWRGEPGETPCAFFIRDGVMYLRTKGNVVVYEHIDSLQIKKEGDTLYSHYKHVDKRYLFKRLGKQYWGALSKSLYAEALQTDSELMIPSKGTP